VILANGIKWQPAFTWEQPWDMSPDGEVVWACFSYLEAMLGPCPSAANDDQILARRAVVAALADLLVADLLFHSPGSV
jgi:hypothetical protein